MNIKNMLFSAAIVITAFSSSITITGGMSAKEAGTFAKIIVYVTTTGTGAIVGGTIGAIGGGIAGGVAASQTAMNAANSSPSEAGAGVAFFTITGLGIVGGAIAGGSAGFVAGGALAGKLTDKILDADSKNDNQKPKLS
jgi:hypothetical protein